MSRNPLPVLVVMALLDLTGRTSSADTPPAGPPGTVAAGSESSAAPMPAEPAPKPAPQVSAVPPDAGSGPDQQAVRESIRRGLTFVEKDGLAWIKQRDCMSCHTVTFMLWSHVEAKSRGIDVDAGKLAEWTKWSAGKSLAARVFFKLDARQSAALPEDIRDKLAPLAGKAFTHEADLLAEAGKLLPAEAVTQHRAAIVKAATIGRKEERNDGGGLDTVAQLLLARDPTAAEPAPDFYSSTADLIARLQDATGMWKAGGQLPARKWPRPVADQTATMWTILALRLSGDDRPAVKAAVDKARAAVAKPVEDPNFEWVVARLLFETNFGAPEAAAAMKQRLLSRRNADGGWSVLPGAESDAFSTGQALYALRVTGTAHDDPVIRAGQKRLLDTQDPDGSWAVSPALTSKGGPDRLKRLEPIWRNWGSSWAVIGLSRSLPGK